MDHYISYCQMALRYQQAEAQDFVTNPAKQGSVSNFYSASALDLMELISQQWQLELNWAQRLRERVAAGQVPDRIETQPHERN